MAGSYTIDIDGSFSLTEGQLALIRSGTAFAIDQLGRHLDWLGSLDVQIHIRPHTDPDNPYPQFNGLLPANPAVTFDTLGRANLVTIAEARTGQDANGAAPDAGFTIYLGQDGTLRNYGAPLWLDPTPRADRDPSIPAGHHDFISIAIHELMHCVGFFAWPERQSELLRQTAMVGGVRYFNGPATLELLGGAGLPLSHPESDHYGPLAFLSRGLMFQYSEHEQNRVLPGRVEFAVLADLGWSVRDIGLLPLSDLDDRQPDLTGSSGADRLYGDFHGNRLSGGAGADELVGAAGDDTLIGGAGGDRIDGGAGLDILIQATGDGTDQVTGVEAIIHAGLSRPHFTPQPHGGFDEGFYLAANPDVAVTVAAGGLGSGRTHWDLYGRAEGRVPTLFLDIDYYLARNPDVAVATAGDAAAALDHWWNYGRAEGRTSSPLFDVATYRSLHPDVAAAGIDPISHYLYYGWAEGRTVSADMAWFG